MLGCSSSDILRMADMALAGPDRRVAAAEPTFEAVLDRSRLRRLIALVQP